MHWQYVWQHVFAWTRCSGELYSMLALCIPSVPGPWHSWPWHGTFKLWVMCGIGACVCVQSPELWLISRPCSTLPRERENLILSKKSQMWPIIMIIPVSHMLTTNRCLAAWLMLEVHGDTCLMETAVFGKYEMERKEHLREKNSRIGGREREREREREMRERGLKLLQTSSLPILASISLCVSGFLGCVNVCWMLMKMSSFKRQTLFLI